MISVRIRKVTDVKRIGRQIAYRPDKSGNNNLAFNLGAD
jgi:hypothetical protein